MSSDPLNFSKCNYDLNILKSFRQGRRLVPVVKKVKKDYYIYRPVSLIWVLGKIMEEVILRITEKHL